MSVRFLTSVAAVFWLLATLSQGGFGATDTTQKVSLGGQVVGEDNKPILGVTVQPLSWKEPALSLQTDQEGRFSLPIDTGSGRYISLALLAKAADGRLGFAIVEPAKPETVRIVLKPARNVKIAVQLSLIHI